jgi:hypothetical protein
MVIMERNAENRLFIDPSESESNRIKSTERLPTVRRFLQRQDLEELSPLEAHIVEQAMGQFLKEGEIKYSSLNTAAHQDVPVRIYMDDNDDQGDDVSRTMSELEEKGVLVFNEEQSTYSLGLEPRKKS